MPSRSDVHPQTQAHGQGDVLYCPALGLSRGGRAEGCGCWGGGLVACTQKGSAAGPQEDEGAAAAAEVGLGLLRTGLHGHQAPGAALAQRDAVGHTDLQGAALPGADGRGQVRTGRGRAGGETGRGTSGRAGRQAGGQAPRTRTPLGPPAHPPAHPWQCAASTPTSSPTRLSSGGLERCRHTTRSS